MYFPLQFYLTYIFPKDIDNIFYSNPQQVCLWSLNVFTSIKSYNSVVFVLNIL